MYRQQIIELLKSEDPDAVALGLLFAEQWNDTELLRAYNQLITFARSVGTHSIGAFFGEWSRMFYTDEREGRKAWDAFFSIDQILIKNVFGFCLRSRSQGLFCEHFYTVF